MVDPLPLLADFDACCGPAARWSISVPIETGLPLARQADCRDVWLDGGESATTRGHRATRPRELLRSVFAGTQQHIRRPILSTADGQRFMITRGSTGECCAPLSPSGSISYKRPTSPFSWAGANLSTQVVVRGASAPERQSVSRPRVAIVSDLREERWHAMDLVAEMLLLNLRTPEARTRRRHGIAAAPDAPPDPAAASLRSAAAADTADRILNRVWDYPRWLRRKSARLRSLSHRGPQLRAPGAAAACRPAGRSVATTSTPFAACSRVRTEDRSSSERWGDDCWKDCSPRRRSCACSDATRNELIASGVVKSDRVVVVPHGVHPACSPLDRCRRGSRRRGAPRSEPDGNRVELLHVGSTIPRKRIDVLLEVVAALALAASGAASHQGRRSLHYVATTAGRAPQSGGPHRRRSLCHATRAVRDLPPRGAPAADIRSRRLWPAGRRSHGLRHARSRQRPASRFAKSAARRPRTVRLGTIETMDQRGLGTAR